MADLTALDLDSAVRVGRAFGLDVVSAAAVRGGSVNSNHRLEARDGRSFFLRIYEEQRDEGAERELEMLAALARAGVPTAEPVACSGPTRVAHHAGKPVAVFPWVEGEILCQARVTPERARRVGEALARVHSSGVEVHHAGRFGARELDARLERVIATAPAFAEVATTLRGVLAKAVSARDASLPQGLVHGDLFRDNVLWRGERIAALIDFESASKGSFAFDLMVTVHAWCYGEAFSLPLVDALLAGYHAVRRLEPREIAALPVEGAFAALRFATTRITDYSLRAAPGQPPLRDYRRFLARHAAVEGGELAPCFASLAGLG